MKSRIASRTSTIDTEKCVQQSGGMRYDLILVAAQRCVNLKDNIVLTISMLLALMLLLKFKTVILIWPIT